MAADAARAVLVTGATGLVGRRLVASLRDDDAPVRIVSRRPDPEDFDPGVETLQWNGRHVPREALFRLRGLVHLAGEPVFSGRLTETRRRRIRASRVDSTQALVAALGALPETDRPGVFVCASAVGYYGSCGDRVIDESEGPGEGFLSEVCRAWEDAARGAEELGIRTVRLRIGIVLSHRGGALPQMALPFRFGLGGRLGDGSQWFPWIHLDDLVGLVRAVLDDTRYRGPVNAVSPEPVTNAELTRTLGRVLSRPTLFTVPAFALRLALGELSRELLDSRRVLPRVARDAGFRFEYPVLEEALREEL